MPRRTDPESLRRYIAKLAGLDVGYAFGLTRSVQSADCRSAFCAVMHDWGYLNKETARYVGRTPGAVAEYLRRARNGWAPGAAELYRMASNGRPLVIRRKMTPAQRRGQDGTTRVSGGRLPMFLVQADREGLPVSHLRPTRTPLDHAR